MSPELDIVIRSLVVGASATFVMDVWAAVLRRFGIPSLDFALLGRWIGHMPLGRFAHASIGKAAPIRGERFIGWGAHYSIGIAFAALLLASYGLQWASAPTLGPALVIGIATVLAPWLVLQPAMGAGIASSKTPRPLFNSLKSLMTHVVFGIGLFLAASATAVLMPVRP